ncbi:kinase-like domain-containing protein [Rhizophagus clarus]|uniref:Kinase-like domain-containing protein n=1 Tax=Rhizophagus clarus TaxID=94130 RepID=A0A8H3R1G4_9GLOM|nr:kinase-like domain-containing protein [Rhizophagus clarus]
MQNTKNINESINWIEEAISKGYYKFYEYKNFNNIQKIGTGGFGKVYRANWKNSEQYLALKSFFNFDDITAREIVHELKLQRDIQFHDNIIKFYGVAQFDPENQIDGSKNYLLVMEYADSGPLNSYLKKNYNRLTWHDKYNLAYQLACAVSCLHNEGIVHRDLHSGNVLIHQNTVKLSDFGLSKRIKSSSNTKTQLFGIIPYVDPKKFGGGRKNKNSQIFSLNEKSDIYSVGVLFWEISNGQPPFYTEGEQYDIDLAIEISQGRREEPIPNTPEDYIKIYTECWDGEPDKRPTINQVVERLKEIITKTIKITGNNQTGINPQTISAIESSTNNINTFSNTDNSSDNSLHGEMSQVIQNFDKMNTNEIINKFGSREKIITKTNILSNTDNSLHGEMSQVIQDFDTMNTDEIINKFGSQEKIITKTNIFSNTDNSLHGEMSQVIQDLDTMNTNEIINKFGSQENNITKTKVFSNADNSLHGVMSQVIQNFDIMNTNEIISTMKKVTSSEKNPRIETNEDNKKAFDLFINASKLGHTLAQFYVGLCYETGRGVGKDEKLAFKYYEKIANLGCASGFLKTGYFYNFGIGITINKQKAIELYQQAANLGNNSAQYNLALMYQNGNGVYKDYDKAFELFKQSAEGGNSDGIMMLGYCYNNGIGTNINKRKAFKFYQRAANLGNNLAQYNLAIMYEDGIGVEKDYSEAFKLYRKAANLGNSLAQYNTAVMYEYGKGIGKDINQAIYWYEKSADQGYQDAQSKLENLRNSIIYY